MLARMALVISCCALGGSAFAADNPIPLVDNPLAPSSTQPGTAGIEVTVHGSGFVPGSVVQWNGSARATTFRSDRQLTARIPASDLKRPTSAFVTVVNPAPGGGRSNVAYFQVVAARDVVGFKRRQTYASGSGSFPQPFNLITTDLDDDGDLDLASANVGDSTMSVYLGNGDGTFASQVQYNAHFAIDLAAGDFNGDGTQDLAVLDFGKFGGGPGNVLLMLGNGDGTLRPPLVAPAGVAPFSIAVADVDRDGKLDAVVTNNDNGNTVDTTSVLFGNGDGTLRPPVPYVTGLGSAHVNIGDVNADGILDLVVDVREGSNPRIAVLLGNGDGTFAAPMDIPFDGDPIWSALGDLNHDGTLDLAVVNEFDSSVAVLLGNGDGTFGSPASYITGPYTVNVAVGIADFNGDDVQDLEVNASEGMATFLGTPSGAFERAGRIDVGNLQGIAIGDFDRDGGPDFAVVGWVDAIVNVWVQARVR